MTISDDNLSSCDLILAWLKEQAERKMPIDPMRYIEAAEKLNAMKSDETDKLIDLQFAVAELRSAFLALDDSVAAAKMKVESHPKYKELRKQEEKIKIIDESIRLAKLHGRLKSEEMRAGQ